ncbi:MAG: hypothetical protein ACRDP4_00175 [Nocardioidaceae bacterium]
MSPYQRCADICNRYDVDSTAVRALKAAMPTFQAVLARHQVRWQWKRGER